MGRKDGVFLLFIAVCHTFAGPNLPRGVGPDFAKYYNNKETFSCISNPAIQVAVSRINDDFCDCPDGSDEPGTAACSGISPLSPHPLGSIPGPDGIANTNSTPTLPGFYCYNKGHQPAYVPFENVNDGVCDYDQCCDGSEEWEGINDVKCPDRCAEFGKERRVREDERQRARNAAFSRRRQLAVEAQRLRREVQDRVVSLKTEVEGGKKMVAKMEEELAEIEKEERAKMVKSPKEAGSMSVLVSLVKDRIEELKGALIDVREDRTALKNRLAQVEGMLKRLKEEHDPYLLDKGVKDVVQSWEEYSTRDKEVERGEEVEKDINEILKSDEENGINWEEWKDIEIGDTAHLYDLTAYLPPTVRTWFETRLTDLRQYLIDNNIIAPNAFSSLFPSSSSSSSSKSIESKRLTDAKDRLKIAKSDLDSQRKEIDNHVADLVRDYSGSDKKDDIFRALKGTCVQLDAGEYTYELCFMERASQKKKRTNAGSRNTNMGNFAKMERIEVREEDLDLERHDRLVGGADGDGAGSSKSGSAGGKRLRLVQRYESGQSCWNGPRRSTTVVLACAEKDELWRVVEEENCVYRMEVGTAAACDDGGAVVVDSGSSDSVGAGKEKKGKKKGKGAAKENNKDEL